MSRALLEVIALDAVDAEAAEAGGADRLEIVTGMEHDGLTPTPQTVASIRSASSLPMRVMLRAGDGFLTDAAQVAELREAAADLAAAGANAFVLGFLDRHGDLDLASMRAVASAVDLPWTCHRAIDHSRDRHANWPELRHMPGLDTVLTAGSASGVSDGLPHLERHAADDAGLILAGGGLRQEHLPALAAAGIRQFHVGSLVRHESAWEASVDATLVRSWREAVDAAVGG